MIRCLRAKIFPGAFATPRLPKSTGGQAKRLSPRRSLRRSQGRPRWRAAGFTMIELLVVLVILGLIAAFAVPQVMKRLGGARTDAAAIQVQNLSTVLDLYRLDTGRYPTQDEGLDALLERPADARQWNGPYVKRRDRLVDPWGNEYRYRFPGDHAEYDIYSFGADNAEGGEGESRDLTSW